MSAPIPSLLGLTNTVIIVIVVVAVLFICLLWVLGVYNGLVRKRQSCKESWSDIDTELKRRHDLIPNLVNTVKGYAAHESGVMEEVTKLRNEAVEVQDKGAGARGKVEGQLGASVGKLVARAEAYPDLKASANFLELQKELSETETRIARSRRFYNSNVREFHNGCQMIPASIIAGMGGFKVTEFDFFEVEDASERDSVDVKFDDDKS
ncbi:MAG: LemA family protein [Phycisphaerales bacterium]|nr:LemA family protein [Phycisphaerales bacterium]